MKKRTYPNEIEDMLKKVTQNGDGYSVNTHFSPSQGKSRTYGFIHFENSNDSDKVKQIGSYDTLKEYVSALYRESEAYHAAQKVRQSFVEVEVAKDE